MLLQLLVSILNRYKTVEPVIDGIHCIGVSIKGKEDGRVRKSVDFIAAETQKVSQFHIFLFCNVNCEN